jgi:uncharacterized damage-inducible protein DinB
MTSERDELIKTLDKHRGFLRQAVQGLTDEQAASRPTVSELCLGGLVKHVAYVEAGWARFMVEGASGLAAEHEDPYASHQASFRMEPGETLAGLLASYDDVAGKTDALIAELPDLGAGHPLPPAPWFEQGASWSVRRVALHILAETAQHAGHADIIREAIDGAKTMG